LDNEKKSQIKMAKKKQKGNEQKKSKAEEYMVEVSQTVSDVKSFIDKFKSDVKKKRRGYQSYAQKLRKKKVKERKGRNF